MKEGFRCVIFMKITGKQITVNLYVSIHVKPFLTIDIHVYCVPSFFICVGDLFDGFISLSILDLNIFIVP